MNTISYIKRNTFHDCKHHLYSIHKPKKTHYNKHNSAFILHQSISAIHYRLDISEQFLHYRRKIIIEITLND